MVSAATDMEDGERSSLGEARLSRISCNTKYAIALNQIDRIDVCETHDRAEDGVTLYVLGVYVLRVQTGIPTVSRTPRARPRRRKWYERWHRPHHLPADEPHPEQQEEEDEDEDTRRKDPLLRKREREKNPHYRVAYRFSEFYQLREELREMVNAPEDALHTKWCAYCAQLNWLVNDAPFPSRWPPGLDALVNKIAWLKQWRVRHRKRKLALFLKEIVQGARSMQYRFSGDQCDGFLNTAFVLKEFLSEPQLSQSFVGW